MGARRLILTDNGQIELLEDSANGTNKVIWKAPASVASDVTFTWPGTLPGSTQFLQVSAAGVMSFAVGTSTLDSAYESGQNIVADSGDIVITGAGKIDIVADLDTDGQLISNTTGTAGGLVIGADCNLYRDSADHLKTDDSVIVAGAITIQGGLNFGLAEDTNLFRSGADMLRTNDALVVDLDLTVSGGDITIGADCNLTRDAANVLRTNDNFTVDLDLTVSQDLTVSGGDITIGADVLLTRTAANVLSTGDGDEFRVNHNEMQVGDTGFTDTLTKLSINSSTTSTGAVEFDDNGIPRGSIIYDHADDEMQMIADNATFLTGIGSSKFAIGGGSGPTFTTGSAAPSAGEPSGSVYLRTGQSDADLCFYVRTTSAWVPLTDTV